MQLSASVEGISVFRVFCESVKILGIGSIIGAMIYMLGKYLLKAKLNTLQTWWTQRKKKTKKILQIKTWPAYLWWTQEKSKPIYAISTILLGSMNCGQELYFFPIFLKWFFGFIFSSLKIEPFSSCHTNSGTALMYHIFYDKLNPILFITVYTVSCSQCCNVHHTVSHVFDSLLSCPWTDPIIGAGAKPELAL